MYLRPSIQQLDGQRQWSMLYQPKIHRLDMNLFLNIFIKDVVVSFTEMNLRTEQSEAPPFQPVKQEQIFAIPHRPCPEQERGHAEKDNFANKHTKINRRMSCIVMKFTVIHLKAN